MRAWEIKLEGTFPPTRSVSLITKGIGNFHGYFLEFLRLPFLASAITHLQQMINTPTSLIIPFQVSRLGTRRLKILTTRPAGGLPTRITVTPGKMLIRRDCVTLLGSLCPPRVSRSAGACTLLQSSSSS